MPHLAAILLAAGGSTRMGKPKQLQSLGGKTLVRRAIDAAIGAGCDPVVVVLGGASESVMQELTSLAVCPVINSHWSRGIGTSLRAGARAILELKTEPDSVTVLLCDQPLVDAGMLRRLFDAREASGKEVAVSAYNKTIGPPVVLSASLLPELLNLNDDQGAKALWMSRPEALCEVPCPQAAVDVDTPADFETLEAEFFGR